MEDKQAEPDRVLTAGGEALGQFLSNLGQLLEDPYQEFGCVNGDLHTIFLFFAEGKLQVDFRKPQWGELSWHLACLRFDLTAGDSPTLDWAQTMLCQKLKFEACRYKAKTNYVVMLGVADRVPLPLGGIPFSDIELNLHCQLGRLIEHVGVEHWFEDRRPAVRQMAAALPEVDMTQAEA